MPKVFLKQNGTYYFRIIAEKLIRAGINDIYLVCRPDAVPTDTDGLYPVVNPEPDAGGMISSVRCGLEAAGERDVLIVPVDHPHISSETFRELLQYRAERPGLVIRAAAGGKSGHPVLLPAGFLRYLPLRDFPGGLAGVIRASGVPVADAETGDDGIFRNINTPADL